MGNTSEPMCRWYHPTPDYFVLGLLALEGFLLLSEWFGWFAFNQPVGQTMLIALTAIGLTLLLMLSWLAVAVQVRRRFQFTLRSLLLLVVAVAIGCSWLAVEMKQERHESELAREIRKAGGKAGEYQTLLGRLLRDDSLVVVHNVELSGTPTTDAGLMRLCELRQLINLSLHPHSGHGQRPSKSPGAPSTFWFEPRQYQDH